MHPRSLIPSAAAAACAALLSGCGSTSVANSSRLEAVVRDSHLVAVAYRTDAKAQGACFRKFRRGEITTDADAAKCLSDGITRAHLEASIETFRRQVLDVGRHGDDDCRRAAERLAAVIAQEEGYIRASRDDLARLDARGFSDDGMRAGETTAREADPSAALLQACTG